MMKRKQLASKRKQHWGNSARMGIGNPNFSGGRYMDDKGYIRILDSRHPYNKLGRYLRPWETVHHINEIKIDNRLDNLYLCTVPEHTAIHSEGRKQDINRRNKMREGQRARKREKKARTGFVTKNKICASPPGRR
jgi:hypothetical protein